MSAFGQKRTFIAKQECKTNNDLSDRNYAVISLSTWNKIISKITGKSNEYKIAAEWIDKVAAAANCLITDVMVVPGNHDIDRDQISSSAKWQLEEIQKNGETALDTFLENEL